MRWIFYISIALLTIGQGIAEDVHWAFQPLRTVEPPEVRNTAWRGHAIDGFIAGKLEEKELSPAEPATDAAWLRRLTYDLTGVPPAPEDMAAFLKDPDRAAAVDRLLASPHFGERWGRMWLDAVHYADSNGQDENKAMANAWRYRDWVVRAFNTDLPYQHFLQHQLAGDLIEGGNEKERLARLVATGFLVIGPKILAEQDKEKMVMDIIDEQIDTLVWWGGEFGRTPTVQGKNGATTIRMPSQCGLPAVG